MTRNAQATLIWNSKETRDAILQRLNNGDESAREDFIKANLPLVYSIAKRYVTDEVDFEDLVHEGVIGLIRALDKYDYSLGYQFSTYATWWIRQAIERYVYTCNDTIKKPSQFGSYIREMASEKQDFRLETGRTPTLGELASRVGMDENRVKNLQSLYAGTLSLDEPLSEENRNDLYFQLKGPDHVEEDVVEQCMNEEIEELMADALGELPERDQKILRMRYGFDGGKGKTLRATARVMGLSAERIRQIESNAFRKLRSLKQIKTIRSYLN